MLARTIKENDANANFIEAALAYLEARGVGKTPEDTSASEDFDLNSFRLQVYGTTEAAPGSDLDFIFRKHEEGQQLAQEAFMTGRFVAHKTYEELQKKGVTGHRSEELEQKYGATFQGLSDRSTQNIHNIGFSRIYNWIQTQAVSQTAIGSSQEKAQLQQAQK